MKTLIGYHGTNASIESKDSILIDFNSSHQFYGPAFYIALDRESAEYYGKQVYRICFAIDNLFKVEKNINEVHSIEEMKIKFPMKEILYEGELQLKGYKRFMIIGRP